MHDKEDDNRRRKVVVLLLLLLLVLLGFWSYSVGETTAQSFNVDTSALDNGESVTLEVTNESGDVVGTVVVTGENNGAAATNTTVEFTGLNSSEEHNLEVNGSNFELEGNGSNAFTPDGGTLDVTVVAVGGNNGDGNADSKPTRV
jgi:hypothetical protein